MSKRKYTQDRELDKLQLEKIKKNAGDNTIKYDLAIRLNQSLIDQGPLTQEWLAKASGISIGSISNYLNGKVDPTMSALLKISEALNVSCDYLLTGVKAVNNDIHIKTGLSDSAIDSLINISNKYAVHYINREESIGASKVLNIMLENTGFLEIIKGIGDIVVSNASISNNNITENIEEFKNRNEFKLWKLSKKINKLFDEVIYEFSSQYEDTIKRINQETKNRLFMDTTEQQEVND